MTKEVDRILTVKDVIEVLSIPEIDKSLQVMIRIPGLGCSPVMIIGSAVLEGQKILVMETIPLVEQQDQRYVNQNGEL